VSGGAEQVAWETAKRLADWLEVHMLTTGRSGRQTKEHVCIHYVPRLPFLTILYSTIAKREIDRTLSGIHVDLIHSHIALPWGYVFRRAKSKRVITCHGSDIFPRKNHPVRFFLMSALKHADAVTVPSRWICRYLGKEYGIASTVIPNGVDTKMFRPMTTVPRRDNVVLFVGRFIERKGILDLIEAARSLPEYEFWLVGDPNAEGSVRIPVLRNVKQIGFVGNLTIYYNQATMCAFPSHWENFPIAGLEAMACGKAIIATEPGFSEYIEKGREGILIGPGRVEALVDSIRYLMENEGERRKIEANAREKAALYDWSLVAKQYQTLYRDM